MAFEKLFLQFNMPMAFVRRAAIAFEYPPQLMPSMFLRMEVSLHTRISRVLKSVIFNESFEFSLTFSWRIYILEAILRTSYSC